MVDLMAEIGIESVDDIDDYQLTTLYLQACLEEAHD
jgi:hypothetical protein